ncbi:DJ-1/PfpI family protein [Ruegeria sp. EL01]|jgi:transcriptional regulator GlxA family with amidase domain|uniref:DJ-1/PfpI family protein n=1 Tax=Ruegeria sp. EL01 TaxID=2107578 RepID=UPI000EA7F47E|nr:DJ-1/PfpI family protein [Ruegeria sp. EL01]
MRIAIVLYTGLTALDALGPYELLKYLPNVDIRFVAHQVGPVPNDRGLLLIGATHTFAETPDADIVLVPGSEANTLIAAADKTLTDWLRQVHAGSRFTTSVCSGAVILGAAGLLKGKSATTHWSAMNGIKQLGATPCPSDRIVQDGKIWTAAGVSAGLDLALALIEKIEGRPTAEKIQLLIEYDPQPTLDAGHMSKASEAVSKAAKEDIKRLSRNPMTPIALFKLIWRKALLRARSNS